VSAAQGQPTTETILHLMNHLPPPVDRVIAAANRVDIDGFLAGFMQDGVVDDWGASSSGVRQFTAGAITSSSGFKSG
jgi:hypothetical protein